MKVLCALVDAAAVLVPLAKAGNNYFLHFLFVKRYFLLTWHIDKVIEFLCPQVDTALSLFLPVLGRYCNIFAFSICLPLNVFVPLASASVKSMSRLSSSKTGTTT
jgi:hypothetical protein